MRGSGRAARRPIVLDIVLVLTGALRQTPCDQGAGHDRHTASRLTDTQAFCAHYGASLQHSVNAILIKSKTGELKFALCVIPALSRLDVNRTARKKLGARKVSFASADDTLAQTRMEIGGVTPLGVPEGLPVWVDESVMGLEYVILGGGNRTSKIKVPPDILSSRPSVEIVPGLALQDR